MCIQEIFRSYGTKHLIRLRRDFSEIMPMDNSTIASLRLTLILYTLKPFVQIYFSSVKPDCNYGTVQRNDISRFTWTRTQEVLEECRLIGYKQLERKSF